MNWLLIFPIALALLLAVFLYRRYRRSGWTRELPDIQREWYVSNGVESDGKIDWSEPRKIK